MTSAPVGLAFLVALALAACASAVTPARPDPAPPADSRPDAPADATARSCPLGDCTFGHRCCVGGCAGSPAAMLNDCCACLPGETTSLDCPGGCGR